MYGGSEDGAKIRTMFCGLGNDSLNKMMDDDQFDNLCPHHRNCINGTHHEVDDNEEEDDDDDALDASLEEEIKNLPKKKEGSQPTPEDVGKIFKSTMKTTLPLFEKIMRKSINTQNGGTTKMFRKSDFCDVVKKKREEFMFDTFSKDIEKISEFLREQAMKMGTCKFSYVFTIPDIYDISSVETILREYFRDCGYTTLTKQGDEKDSIKTIKVDLS